jgi:hypothetical protein
MDRGIKSTLSGARHSTNHALPNGVLKVNCRKALELMAKYADADLGVWIRWRLRIHVWICRNCRRYLSSYRATIRIAKSTRDKLADAANERIPKALITSILDETGRR